MLFASVTLVALVTLQSAGTPIEDGSDVHVTRYQAEVVFEGGLATLDVHLDLENRSKAEVGNVSLDLDLPEGGVARRFELREAGPWQASTLLPRELAEQRFEQLFEEGRAAPRAVGLLSHRDGGAVSLRVFPLMPGARVQVRYQVLAPLQFREGRWGLDTRPEGMDTELDDQELVLKLVPRELDVAVSADGRRAWRTGGLSTGEVEGRAASARLPSGDWATHIHFGAAAPLSHAPRGASVVFVLDASHSEGHFGIAGQLHILRSYLTYMPDALVELVVFRRHAERIFGGFVPAREVEARLARLAPHRLAPGNGSALDAGLALAAEALKGRAGPLRVVSFTDGRLRNAFSPGSRHQEWPPGTLLHVALVQVDWTREEPRWDSFDGPLHEHPLAPLAETTGGIVAAPFPLSGEDMSSAEELVRPVRIDAPRLFVGEVPWESEQLPPILEEGETVSEWLRTQSAPGAVHLEGRLWSRTVRWPLEVDVPTTRILPALTVNAPKEAPFEEEDRAAAARSSGIVGPGQSALAAHPGAGPMGLGVRDFGGGSRGFGFTIGCHAASARDVETPKAGTWIASLLRAAAQRCRADPVTLQVETTFGEVVDVRAADPVSPKVSCLVEAAWDLRLDRRFTQAHGVFDVQLTPSRVGGAASEVR